ncbi:MAG: hypothetical protein C5B53_12180 [Candidatus Melainabacteria bacterium]|nr:MAG: hypothetical protein C5B53_12180 [Candidatus Melainabacteria bacterium]
MNDSVRHSLLPILVACIFYTASSALADSWETTICAADTAEKVNNLETAEKLYAAALKQAESFGEGDPRLFMSIRGMADLYTRRGNLDKAQSLYLRYLTLADHYAPQNRSDRLDIIIHIASISRSKGRMLEAIAYYRKALALAKQELGENSEQVAMLNAFIGYCCYFSRQYNEGIAAVKETLRIHQMRQPDSLQLANDLAQLAGLYGDVHDYAQAEALGKQAMAIRKRLLKPGDVLIVRSIEGLAINKANQHKNDEAIALFNEGFHMAERAFGKDSSDMSVYMMQLAGAYQDKGDYNKAIPLYEKSLTIQKKVLKPGGDNSVRAASGLADCYQKSGNPGKARQVCQDYLKWVANAKVSDEALSKIKNILDKCH